MRNDVIEEFSNHYLSGFLTNDKLISVYQHWLKMHTQQLNRQTFQNIHLDLTFLNALSNFFLHSYVDVYELVAFERSFEQEVLR